MGQKVNPIGFRTAVHKEWKSRWFAGKKAFGDLLNEDLVIRDMVRMYHGDAADEIKILYGGSVKPDNAKEILDMEDIDGALVGGASLDPVDFLKIIQAAEN